MNPALRKEALSRLRALRRWGFLALPLANLSRVAAPIGADPALVEPAPEHPAPPPPKESGDAAPAAADEAALPENASALDAIAAEIASCRRCPLCETRSRTVPGEGSPEARVVFVGEGPGYYEDRQGRPFVGAAGDLLTKMIRAMWLRREDVFICNVVKCRPPKNRDPEPEEIAACEGYLLRQLDTIQPKLIVALGRFAAQTLLRTTDPISKLRGRWREYHGIRLMPTFHPAYLLRHEPDKGKCWQDLQKVMAEYERIVGPLPAQGAAPPGGRTATD